MSELPFRPSLNHLRKQAKERLHHLRQQNLDATLTEAQHVLAREYGFESWPKLKAHVDRLVTLPRPVTFQRYTPKAREAVFFSRHEAGRQGSRTIEPEHVLLGVFRASQGLKGQMFDGAGVTLDRVRVEIVPTPSGEPLSSAERVPPGERARELFRTAALEADALEHRDVGLVHLLLGMLHEQDSAAANLLRRIGMDADTVRGRIPTLLNEEQA